QHWGILGMKWGVRRVRKKSTESRVIKSKRTSSKDPVSKGKEIANNRMKKAAKIGLTVGGIAIGVKAVDRVLGIVGGMSIGAVGAMFGGGEDAIRTGIGLGFSGALDPSKAIINKILRK
ncbi:MAG: hypothetical protein IJ022_07715, partial [Burkholderiaceae bacterium]|nr:hypothetical protein [Burkholderiaceae bacterium]